MATWRQEAKTNLRHEKSMSCFVVLLPKHLPFSKIFRIFAVQMSNLKEQ
jgi:hypothetical protein